VSEKIELKSTINLPRTKFSMKANLPQREPKTLEWWDNIGVYGRIRAAHAGDPTFVLHDGPPYANGHIHLGQALNKILKDIVVKSRAMLGHDTAYVPGWDCHGLPIEHRVDKELGAARNELGALEIRERCRKYAESFIDVQRNEFQRLGVFWDRERDRTEEQEQAPSRLAIYRTLDRTYEAEIIRQLGRFFEGGAIYHGVKPVHWCPSCHTALAEAEVEHADRTDPSIYVKFPVSGLEKRIPALAGRTVSLVAWTTTPWTLPANLAVALNPDLPYVAVEVGTDTFIVAEGLLASVASKLGWDSPATVASFTGLELVGQDDDWVAGDAPVTRPYLAPSGAAAGTGLLILGQHVTLEAGSGCVHTAPGHGADDFIVGQKYGLDVFNPVGGDGKFIASMVSADWLADVFVLKANTAIIADLEERGLLLSNEPFTHSYPHCWRCRRPVLFRSTPQWFISMDATGLRQNALEQIRASNWIPARGEARIAQMIETRPDWCISRQRTWGVPIPAVVCSACFEDNDKAFITDPTFFEHVSKLFLEEGSNAWFGILDGDSGRHRPYDSVQTRLDRLVPPGVTCPCCNSRDHLTFSEHIVDVWFESGVSHSATLGRVSGLPWPADVYLEGHDQYRGWFHSSLLVAVNDCNQAPFKQVLVHGFTLDKNGRKMSKSIGNTISPLDVADRRGAEILRLWVSMIDFLEDMKLSDETLDRNSEAYRKIRNTFRYLLGNLRDFDPERDQRPYDELEEIDRWALQRFDQLRRRLIEAYTEHHYHVVYHELHNFCSVTLSSFYLDILKDRLYTYPAGHPARRSAQTVLHHLADGLVRLMAPVLCFTAEEIWQELEQLQGRERWVDSSIHTLTFPEALDAPEDTVLLERWERLMAIRSELYRALEQARTDKVIGSFLQARLTIQLEAGDREFLESFGDTLHVLFITSEVGFGTVNEGAFHSEKIPGLAVQIDHTDGEKCERCWNFTYDRGTDPDWPEICARCTTHVHQIISESASA
jgi:isoleucyl-tRNA synthetase